MSETIIKQIADGRADLVFDYLAAGHPATSADKEGTSLINWCAYYGDVSAIKFLLANGECLESLGDNLGLDAAAFHGHWRLCQFVLRKALTSTCPCPTREKLLFMPRCPQLVPRRTWSPKSCSRTGPIRTARRSRPSKPAPSCVTAVLGPKLLCTALQLSPLKAPFSFFSMLAQES